MAKEKLTPSELEKSERMDELTDQFMAADKVVCSAPFWNLSFPPMLKAYMDTICIVGKTFHYTAEGVDVNSSNPSVRKAACREELTELAKTF